MLAALLALALCAFAADGGAPVQLQGQAAAPAFPAAPAASTETAPSPTTSTTTASAAPAVPPPPPPKPVKHIQVLIHPDSGSWEPVSLFGGGDPDKIATLFTRRLKRHVTRAAAAPTADGQPPAGGEAPKPVVTYKGENMGAAAIARVYPIGDDKLLVVSVHPAGLAAKRIFVEVRFRVVEGYLEEAKVAKITVGPGANVPLAREDSQTLAKKGIAFGEDFPGSGRIGIAAISLRPSGLNAGTVSLAAFADEELRTANFTWSAKISRE